MAASDEFALAPLDCPWSPWDEFAGALRDVTRPSVNAVSQAQAQRLDLPADSPRFRGGFHKLSRREKLWLQFEF